MLVSIPGAMMKSYNINRELTMSRLIPFTVGALQMGLLGVSTYILCSVDTLGQATLFLSH